MNNLKFMPDLWARAPHAEGSRIRGMPVGPLSLDRLEEGFGGTVSEICVTGAMRRRLMDIGFIEGARVQCLQKSPSGDPVAYLIRGAVIALRNADAKEIIINALTN